MNLVQSLSPKSASHRVLGVDGSSTSLAFCLMVKTDGKWTPERWGKIDIVGDNVWQRCGDVNRKLYGVMKLLDPDHVTCESPVFVNSKSVTIQLSKILGAMIGVVVATGRKCDEVTPIAWMAYIGNPTRDSKAFKDKMLADNPGKPKGWYKTESRRLRKARTSEWVEREYGIKLDDDDVSDAFGIVHYSVHNLI
jgi:Holliday junction resolvasome RuvABC endonuclease subunit